MKSILLKTFYTMKSSFIILMLTSIIYFFILKNDSMSSNSLDLIVISMFSVSSLIIFFQNEFLELNNFNNFLIVCPINKKTILKAKFLSYIIILISIYIIVFLISLFLKTDYKDILQIKYNLLYITFFSVFICTFSINYLIFFIFNKNIVVLTLLNTLIVFISSIIIGLISFLIINLLSFILKTNEPSNSILFITGIFNFIFSLIIMFICYKICLKKYNNSSF